MPPGIFSGLGVLTQSGGSDIVCHPGGCWAWNIDMFWGQKIIHEDLSQFIKILNYNKSSCIIFVPNCCKYFLIHIIHKIFETFWSRDVISIQGIITFWAKIRKEKVWTISSIHVLNCSKCFPICILGQNVQKNQIRKTISSLHEQFSVSKWQDIHKDFWTISSGTMFQYFHIVYIKIITQ